MVKRKTPVEHGVSGYTRDDGTRVGSYRRGQGTKPQRRSRSVGNTIFPPREHTYEDQLHDAKQELYDLEVEYLDKEMPSEVEDEYFEIEHEILELEEKILIASRKSADEKE